MKARKTCYATMFPDPDRVALNRPSSGKAFEVLVKHRYWISSRQVTVRPVTVEMRTTGRLRLSVAKPVLTMALAVRT